MTRDPKKQKVTEANTPLIRMKDQFSEAKKYFDNNKNATRYERYKSGLKLGFIKIPTKNNGVKILARLDTLGEGGFGKVKRYVDENGTVYAVKRAKKGTLEHDKEFLELDKKGQVIGTVIDSKYDRKTNKYYNAEYLAIEYIDALNSNDSNITNRQKAFRKYANVIKYKFALAILDALETVHTKEIVHLDIKPGNIMLKVDPKTSKIIVRLIDFGLAQKCKANEVVSNEFGTLEYMAPEVSDKEEASHKSDIYSLGIMYRDNLMLDEILCKAMCANEPDYRLSIPEIRIMLQRKVQQDQNAIVDDYTKLSEEEFTIINFLEDIYKKYSTLKEISSDFNIMLKYALLSQYNQATRKSKSPTDELKQYVDEANRLYSSLSKTLNAIAKLSYNNLRDEVSNQVNSLYYEALRDVKVFTAKIKQATIYSQEARAAATELYKRIANEESKQEFDAIIKELKDTSAEIKKQPAEILKLIPDDLEQATPLINTAITQALPQAQEFIAESTVKISNSNLTAQQKKVGLRLLERLKDYLLNFCNMIKNLITNSDLKNKLNNFIKKFTSPDKKAMLHMQSSKEQAITTKSNLGKSQHALKNK